MTGTTRRFVPAHVLNDIPVAVFVADADFVDPQLARFVGVEIIDAAGEAGDQRAIETGGKVMARIKLCVLLASALRRHVAF